MAHGTIRGAATACLGLIVLQTVATQGNGRVAQLLGDVNALVLRLLDPTVPAIPDLRNGETWGGTGTTPAAPARPRPNSAYDMGPRSSRLPIPGQPLPT